MLLPLLYLNLLGQTTINWGRLRTIVPFPEALKDPDVKSQPMVKVKMAEVPSRFGNFTIIKMGQTVLISQCDTRMKILAALSENALTGEELTREIGVSYSAVMDHMDCLERLRLVTVSLKSGRWRRGKEEEENFPLPLERRSFGRHRRTLPQGGRLSPVSSGGDFSTPQGY